MTRWGIWGGGGLSFRCGLIEDHTGDEGRGFGGVNQSFCLFALKKELKKELKKKQHSFKDPSVERSPATGSGTTAVGRVVEVTPIHLLLLLLRRLLLLLLLLLALRGRGREEGGESSSWGRRGSWLGFCGASRPTGDANVDGLA